MSSPSRVFNPLKPHRECCSASECIFGCGFLLKKPLLKKSEKEVDIKI
jgi:hypothetical protein